jgi:hypothetical protein
LLGASGRIRANDARIVTSDPDVLAVARAEKLATIALPGQG